ncbi:MAG: RNase adapter RapZ [Rhodospirillales bacterium]|nr:RNase adapter RapZ [Rhodospirillales bacterium]QQS15068.1 MAG: RNase adapter RapZ [Rhodospirillales bacterium]
MITGLSGAGRATSLRALEDAGYVAVDNLPLAMVDALLRPAGDSDDDGEPDDYPLAIGVDVRTRGFDVRRVVARIRALRARADLDARLLFLDCDNDVLLRRYTETRRRHPLAADRPVLDGIVDERRVLRSLRDHADSTIDTSQLGPHELKSLLLGQFATAAAAAMRVAVTSFSYRRGLPREADLVFDARFLRNPYWSTALRGLDGRNATVRRYVVADRDYKRFFGGILSLLSALLPRFEREGKSYLTVAVGCTGGRHRSVVVAEQLADRLRRLDRPVALTHRDIDTTPGAPVAAAPDEKKTRERR